MTRAMQIVPVHLRFPLQICFFSTRAALSSCGRFDDVNGVDSQRSARLHLQLNSAQNLPLYLRIVDAAIRSVCSSVRGSHVFTERFSQCRSSALDVSMDG